MKLWIFLTMQDHLLPEQLSKKFTDCIIRLFLNLHTPLTPFANSDYPFFKVFRPFLGRKGFTNETVIKNVFEEFLQSRTVFYGMNVL